MKMRRGTTPTHTFVFKDLNPETFKVLKIYYAQRGQEILSKTSKDCAFSSEETEDGTNYLVSVTLSQENTKLFNPKYPAEVQLRFLTNDDRALATEKYKLNIEDVINDETLE